MRAVLKSQAVAVLLLAAIPVAACQEQEPPPRATSQPPVPYEGPGTGAATAATGDPVWRYNGDDDHLLARGIDNSNVLDVVFRCGGEIPGITFSFFQPGPPPDTVKISSGSAARDYPVRPSPPNFAFSTDWSLGTDAIPKDPVVSAFLDTGKLSRVDGQQVKVWDARTPEDKQAIENFSKACKGKL